MNLEDLCGYGLRHPETGEFLGAETLAAVMALRASPRMLAAMPMIATGPDINRRALWDGARKVLGGDIPQYPQQIGDCVGISAKHAGEYCQVQAMLAGESARFETLFGPYNWAMGRLAPDCGHNYLGRQDGSLGSWQAKAACEYGLLPEDAVAADGEALPPYSGAVARIWGNLPGPAAKWVDLGKKHLVKQVAPVSTATDLASALLAGNPVTIASNIGFTMLPQPDGFHHPQGAWGHQMVFDMVDLGDDKIEPHVGINNNWGDVHGQVVDFRTGERWPTGHLRARLRDAVAMLAFQDSWAYTGVDLWTAPITFEGF